MMEILPRKYMILLEVASGDYHTLDQIAEKIGITKQGVYEYMKKMRGDGLVETVRGKYRATVKGVETLFSYLENLEKYLEEKKRKLNMMEYSVAIADEDIKEGEHVHLFMKNGYLHAARGEGKAVAEAMETAKEGEDVAVRNIRGIIELAPGKIYLLMLPPATRGGSKKINVKEMRKFVEGLMADKIGVMDTIGRVAMEKAGLRIDFEFCAVDTAIEISQKGLNVLLAGEKKEIRYAISKIEEYNRESIEEIEYFVHDFSTTQHQ